MGPDHLTHVLRPRRRKEQELGGGQHLAMRWVEQDVPHPVTDACSAGLAGSQKVVALLAKIGRQEAHLGSLAAAFWSFKGDEQAQGVSPLVQGKCILCPQLRTPVSGAVWSDG
jgi:hypothetical protein